MSHVPYVKREPDESGPNYAHIAQVAAATVFPGYRSFLGWTGLSLLVFAAVFAIEAFFSGKSALAIPLFLGLIGGGILICIWLPATIAAYAAKKLSEDDGDDD